MRNTENMKKAHYNDNKYNKQVADTLKAMQHKIHYKLYMLYTKDGYYENGSHIDGHYTNLNRFAEMMGVSRQQFSKYIRENNPDTPDIYALYRLSQHTHIPFEYLVDDTIEYSDSCSNGNSEQIIDANKGLCEKVVSSHLKSEIKTRTVLWNTFLNETGLGDVFLQRLTEIARKELTTQVKDLVDRALSQKDNLYVPMNPVDDEYIDYIEGEGLCQIM